MDSNLERLRYIAVFGTIDYIAKSLREDTDALFPNGITAKDYEQTFIYAAALFSFWDSNNKNLLNDSFANALNIFLVTLEVDHNYSEAQITETTHNMIDETKKYVHALFDLLQAENYEAALMDYVKIILSTFPSVDSTSPYSLAGVSFINHFNIYYDFLGKVYEILIGDDIEELKAILHEYMLENHPDEIDNSEENQTEQTETLSDKTDKQHKKSTANNNASSSKFATKSFDEKQLSIGFFIVLLLFICSLFGNFYLFASKDTASKEYNTAISDAKYWKNKYNVEKEHIEELTSEYNFYHNHAAIVTEYGNRYHHYGCYHLDDVDSFWIYNTEAAISRGYTPCKDCWD